MSAFASLSFGIDGRSTPMRPRSDPSTGGSGSGSGVQDTALKGLNKKQADNPDYRLRQEEGMNKATVKFPKSSPSPLIKYLHEATTGYADHNPGDAPHPWGPKRYCLTAALLKSMSEDSDNGVVHVDSLFGEISPKKQIEQHDEIAAVANHPSVLDQI